MGKIPAAAPAAKRVSDEEACRYWETIFGLRDGQGNKRRLSMREAERLAKTFGARIPDVRFFNEQWMRNQAKVLYVETGNVC